MDGVTFSQLTRPLPPSDADAGRGRSRVANLPAADVRHQLKGRHPVQLGKGAHQRHLLTRRTHSEEMQAHDHYPSSHCLYASGDHTHPTRTLFFFAAQP